MSTGRREGEGLTALFYPDAGVPYNVTVWALFGTIAGGNTSQTIFTQELGKLIILKVAMHQFEILIIDTNLKSHVLKLCVSEKLFHSTQFYYIPSLSVYTIQHTFIFSLHYPTSLHFQSTLSNIPSLSVYTIQHTFIFSLHYPTLPLPSA